MTIVHLDKEKVSEDTAKKTKDEGVGRGKTNEDKTKDDQLDNEAYEEATSPLRRLLNKYEEGKDRYQTLQRMMDSGTYPIKRAGRDEKEQDKD